MDKITNLVTGLSRLLDRMAGFCMVSIMLIVVANILLRVFLKRPVLGAYEYVCFLTAALIGLALANCALQKGHIAVGVLVDRLGEKTQAVIDTFINAVSLLFWGLSAWYICKYANNLLKNGVVSPTTQTPFYPFLYLIAFGLLALCLVLLVRLADSIKKVAIDR